MKYNYIIFDLDGTLLNTLDDLRDSTNFALRRFGFPSAQRTRSDALSATAWRGSFISQCPRARTKRLKPTVSPFSRRTTKII